TWPSTPSRSGSPRGRIRPPPGTVACRTRSASSRAGAEGCPGSSSRRGRRRHSVPGARPPNDEGSPCPQTPRGAPLASRLLVPSAALLWGLHSSLLSPALALILATLYDASTADIGWSLAIYNAGGFIASIVLPAWADRRRTYLPMLMAAAVLTIALAAALAAVSTLPLATVALVVLGGPAGPGTTMLFAYLRDVGAATSTIVDTRAIISAAWMGGPPLATAIIGWAGARGI